MFIFTIEWHPYWYCTLWSWSKFSRSNIWNVSIAKTARACIGICAMTCMAVDVRHRMASLRMCTQWYWPTFSRPKIWNANVSEMMKGSEGKKYECIDFDICHRTATLRMMCAITLTFIFKIKTFSCSGLATKIAQRQRNLRQICLDLHGSFDVALLLSYVSRWSSDPLLFCWWCDMIPCAW